MNFILLGVFVCVAVYYDIKTFKIPNRLNMTGAVMGLGYSLMFGGISIFLNRVIVMILTLTVMFLFFCVGAMGAGDVKLFAAIGAISGKGVVVVIIVSLVTAAVAGIIINGEKFMRGKRFCYTKIHFSIPILIGVIAYIVYGVCEVA